MFFWHKGPIPDHQYRKADRTMSIDEVKNWLLEKLFQRRMLIWFPQRAFPQNSFMISIWAVDAKKFLVSV